MYVDRSRRIHDYSLVVWSDGHVAEPTELGPEEAGAFWQEELAAGRAVAAVFDPMKVNYFTLGNTVPHLHTHVVPRFVDDPAPAGPIPWDHVVGSPVFTEEELRDQAALFEPNSESAAEDETRSMPGTRGDHASPSRWDRRCRLWAHPVRERALSTLCAALSGGGPPTSRVRSGGYPQHRDRRAPHVLASWRSGNRLR